MKRLADFLLEGSWGYEPDQNDSTLDLMGDITMDICELVFDRCRKNRSDADSCWHALGNIEYFFEELAKMSDFPCGDEPFNKYYYWWRLVDKKNKNIVSLYNDLLQVCENDNDWISEWKEPDKMMESLRKRREISETYQKLFNDRQEYEAELDRQRKDRELDATPDAENTNGFTISQ